MNEKAGMHSPPLPSINALVYASVYSSAGGKIAATSLASHPRFTIAVRRHQLLPEALREIEKVPPSGPSKPLLTSHWLKLGHMRILYPISDKGVDSPLDQSGPDLEPNQGSASLQQ